MTTVKLRALTLGLLASTALVSPAFAQDAAASDATPETRRLSRRRRAPTRPTSPAKPRRRRSRTTAGSPTRTGHRHHRAEARGKSPGRPDQRPGDRHPPDRPAQHLELRGLYQAAAVGQLPDVAPGSTTVYMRGVATGGDGNHTGSLPSVGFYLDEQPVTTIGGTLDVHIYDIARIESLAGPQGTLYGASSEAGTIRIITNKPELGVTSRARRRRAEHGRAWRCGRQPRGHDQPADRRQYRVPGERFLPARRRLHRQCLRRARPIAAIRSSTKRATIQSVASATASTSTMPTS